MHLFDYQYLNAMRFIIAAIEGVNDCKGFTGITGHHTGYWWSDGTLLDVQFMRKWAFERILRQMEKVK